MAKCTGLLLLGMLAAGEAGGQQVREYQMKAVYIYNLAKFVEWPPEAFKSPRDPITICVLGQGPILHALDEAVSGEMIDARKLLVRPVSSPQEVEGCRILFVSWSVRKDLQSILRELSSTASILTVGETPEFTADGGVVGFQLQDKKVRIEINLDAAGRQKLHISPKLLSLAQITKK